MLRLPDWKDFYVGNYVLILILSVHKWWEHSELVDYGYYVMFIW